METITLTHEQTVKLKKAFDSEADPSLYVPLTDISHGLVVSVNDAGRLPDGSIVVCGSGPSFFNPDVLTPTASIINLDKGTIQTYRTPVESESISGSAVRLCVLPNPTAQYSYLIYVVFNLADNNGPSSPYLGILSPESDDIDTFHPLLLGTFGIPAKATAINVSAANGYFIAGSAANASAANVPVVWEAAFDPDNLFNPQLSIKQLPLPSGYTSGEITCGSYADITTLGGSASMANVKYPVLWTILNNTITPIVLPTTGDGGEVLNLSSSGIYFSGYTLDTFGIYRAFTWWFFAGEYTTFLLGDGRQYCSVISNGAQFIAERNDQKVSAPRIFDGTLPPPAFQDLYAYLKEKGTQDLPTVENMDGFTTNNISIDQAILLGNRISAQFPNGEAWMITNPFLNIAEKKNSAEKAFRMNG